ncbi:centrosomal protein kizuna, partial [Gastrophryne carolinensis]
MDKEEETVEAATSIVEEEEAAASIIEEKEAADAAPRIKKKVNAGVRGSSLRSMAGASPHQRETQREARRESKRCWAARDMVPAFQTWLLRFLWLPAAMTYGSALWVGSRSSGSRMSGLGSGDRLGGGAQFYDRIGELQRRLRECEMKRLELEQKLFQHSSSDAHRCQLKYMKLKHSLEEVCEKEKKANQRNQAFLQEFNVAQARLQALISRTSLDRKMLKDSGQEEISTSTGMSRKIYHPATIFMGRQMSANSSIEHCLTQRKSPQPTKSFSISDPHSVRQAIINSNVTDSCVVPANSDTLCLNKTDKIDGETSSSQIRQEMLATSAASSGDAGTHHAEIDMTQSGRKHLAESKQSAQLSTQTRERLSPENRTGDLRNDSPGNKVEDSLMYERLVSNEERFTNTNPSGSSPDACDYINKHASDNHNACENLSGNQLSNLEDNEFLSSSSDLTVSITDSEELDADDLLDAIHAKKEKLTATKKNKNKAEQQSTNQKLPKQQLENATNDEESLSASSISQNILSDKGFIHLLQSIEDMILQTGANNLQLYQNTKLMPDQHDHLVSLCNQLKTMRKEDLEACCALVVQHLQTESTGRSLSDKTHLTHERTISTLLQNHLLGHVSFLNEHGILKGGVPAGFANALILNDEMKTQQNPQMARIETDVTSNYS